MVHIAHVDMCFSINIPINAYVNIPIYTTGRDIIVKKIENS